MDHFQKPCIVSTDKCLYFKQNLICICRKGNHLTIHRLTEWYPTTNWVIPEGVPVHAFAVRFSLIGFHVKSKPSNQFSFIFLHKDIQSLKKMWFPTGVRTVFPLGSLFQTSFKQQKLITAKQSSVMLLKNVMASHSLMVDHAWLESGFQD